MNEIKVGEKVFKHLDETRTVFTVKEIIVEKGGNYHDGYSKYISVLLDDLSISPLYYENYMCQQYIVYHNIKLCECVSR